MSDPYRPAGYADSYYLAPNSYGSPDGYNQSLTTHQHQIQLSPARSSPHEELYYPPSERSRSNLSSDDHHHHRHHSAHSRSRSRRGSSSNRHRDHRERDASDDSKKKSRHAGKAALGVVAGASAGGLLGHEILGGGVVGTVSGMLVGAMGAQALERRHERHKKARSASFGARERSSHGDRKEGLMDKIGGFLTVPGHGDEGRKRSRSHADESGSRRHKRDDSDYSDTEDERGRWRRY